ncbi:MAG TPA: HIRAN domain-containing protein [Puia sp.]
MNEFDKIFLSWRKGQGERRHVVGVLEQTSDKRYVFTYFQQGVDKAEKEGFTPYTEFPETDKVYNGNVLDIFGQRLIKQERPDIQRFYTFWEIDSQYQDNKFYLLGHTQGLLPTDNFEFLAEYNIVDGLHFLTEVAGSSTNKLPAATLSEGDILRFEIDKDNEHDPEAVKVYKDDLFIGYIKKVHCRVFHKPGAENLKLFVKAIDKNGIIKRVFIKVSL